MAISAGLGDEKTKAVDFDLDAGAGPRAAIGLIVLSSDQTIEHEFRTLLNVDGVALFQSRIKNDSRITPETLRAMEARLVEATDVILPGMKLDVVAFACTSASMLIGEDQVFEKIRQARPDARPTTPITAALSALKTFKARKIALLTPYRDDVNREIKAYIEARGLDVVATASFFEEDDLNVCRISEASVKKAAVELGQHPDVEAVFVSCTSLRMAGVIEEIEAILEKPVTSSNHALAWHCLRLAGIGDVFNNRGRLFRLDSPR